MKIDSSKSLLSKSVDRSHQSFESSLRSILSLEHPLSHLLDDNSFILDRAPQWYYNLETLFEFLELQLLLVCRLTNRVECCSDVTLLHGVVRIFID